MTTTTKFRRFRHRTLCTCARRRADGRSSRFHCCRCCRCLRRPSSRHRRRSSEGSVKEKEMRKNEKENSKNNEERTPESCGLPADRGSVSIRYPFSPSFTSAREPRERFSRKRSGNVQEIRRKCRWSRTEAELEVLDEGDDLGEGRTGIGRLRPALADQRTPEGCDPFGHGRSVLLVGHHVGHLQRRPHICVRKSHHNNIY
jgi:hypothetical protein